MPRKQNSGRLSEDSYVFKEITWEIPNFLSLPRMFDYQMRSRKFSFANGTWVLYLYPYGQSNYDSISYIGFWIKRLWSLEPEQEVHWKIFLKTSNGKEFEPFRHCHVFTVMDNEHDAVRFTQHSKVIAMQHSLVPQGTLTVVCQIRARSTAAVEVNSGLEIFEPVTNDEALGEDMKNCKITTEAQIQTERDFGTGSEQFTASTPSQKFIRDYKELLLSGDGCDVTLLVKGQKFEAHRTILRARSPVFASMLKHNMKEKNTGLIDIPDCDPDAFPDFLRFLYCGSVDSINSQNASSLYRAADKYDVQDLKSESLTFIKSHLDVDNFCDVVTLALKHTEADLLQQATDFFARNMLEIIVTVKWQVFVTENPIESNELTIKALSANKSSCP